MKHISRTLELSREQWPPALLRQMWDELMELESGRKKSAEHEARWLNLLGFSLRPGYGMALDDWRVAESWKRLRGQMHHPGPATLTEWWILWRRIAGGLPAGQQEAIAVPLMTRFKDDLRKERHGKGGRRSGHPQEQTEAWRMLGSLERLPLPMKEDLAAIALELADHPDRSSLQPALLWTIGRIGARVPFYGPLNAVVSGDKAERWLESLISTRKGTPERFFAVMQLARRTGDRYRDLSDKHRQRAANWLTSQEAPEEYVRLVEEGGELAQQTSAVVFGESLPIGLRLRSVSSG